MTYTPASETPVPVRLAPVLFTATIFLSASLLFFVQPLYDIGLPLARSAAALGLSAWRQNHDEVTEDKGYRPSDVAMIARTPGDAARILESGLWTSLVSDGGPVWTDDKADPLSILKPGALR